MEEEKKQGKVNLWALFAFLLAVAADQFTKWLAVTYLKDQDPLYYNTGSISVSVSGKPWGCIWNPAESADCICSWSIVDFFCGRLHLRENSAEKKICSVKSMCDPSGIRRHRKSDRSSGKELRSGFLLFQPD